MGLFLACFSFNNCKLDEHCIVANISHVVKPIVYLIAALIHTGNCHSRIGKGINISWCCLLLGKYCWSCLYFGVGWLVCYEYDIGIVRRLSTIMWILQIAANIEAEDSSSVVVITSIIRFMSWHVPWVLHPNASLVTQKPPFSKVGCGCDCGGCELLLTVRRTISLNLWSSFFVFSA